MKIVRLSRQRDVPEAILVPDVQRKLIALVLRQLLYVKVPAHQEYVFNAFLTQTALLLRHRNAQVAIPVSHAQRILNATIYP